MIFHSDAKLFNVNSSDLIFDVWNNYLQRFGLSRDSGEIGIGKISGLETESGIRTWKTIFRLSKLVADQVASTVCESYVHMLTYEFAMVNSPRHLTA